MIKKGVIIEMIPERLSALREEMKKRNIDIYLVPTSDFHESEYVGDYFKARKFISGFTGSAGTAVITMTEAGLWTDGRYFIQAENQLKDTTVTLYKMGQEGVPTVKEFIEKKLPEKGILGFDGRVINACLGEEMLEIAEAKGGSLAMNEDLIDLIWNDRPELPANPAWILDVKYAGETVESKLNRIRKEMKDKGANTHIATCLYDICWIYNLRGDDISHVPVFLSFTMITEEEAFLYANEAIFKDEVKKYLADNKVTLKPYEAIYEDVKSLSKDRVILLDKTQVNTRITGNLPEGIKIVNDYNPADLMKSMKNETELENIKKAHIKDAVAVTKFMYWVKNNAGKMPINEYTAGEYLQGLRAEQEGYIDISFDTIAGYKANAAMMHYSASKENNAELKAEGMLLVDSGGHYLEGSTDITRTFALGPVSDIEKKHFTAVLRSNMQLAHARFLYGCTGINLDVLARGPIWDMDLDYQCGTGHGVGYLLNIHEGPNGFRWKKREGVNDGHVLEEGMVTTDEPGIYLEGKYGIRLEDELVCRKGEKNEYGQFMYFEDVTYVPMDLDLVDVEELSKKEIKWLNDYHKNVYEIIAPLLTKEEADWLKTYTRAIG